MVTPVDSTAAEIATQNARHGIVVHGTAMLTLADPVMRAVNVSMFLKGLAMIGCALFITQFGVRT